jgi:hypothetical protein
MAMETASGAAMSSGHALKRGLIGAGVVVALALVALIVCALTLSGASLAGDSTALAKVSVQPLGGTIQHVEAFGPTGRKIAMSVHDDLLTPLSKLSPGELVSVDVVVHRPGWLGWAIGSKSTEHLTLRAPVAHVSNRWLTVQPGSDVQVGFDQPVTAISYGSTSTSLKPHALSGSSSTVSIGSRPATGTVEVAAAARTWEKVGAPAHVS